MNITEQEYRQKYTEDSSVGWDCIDQALALIYKEGRERHYGTIISYMLGGQDPLDGVSIYDNNEQQFHRHLISYGMSELYFSPELAGKEYSKWGFEFTFRIAPFAEDEEYNDAKNEPMWAINVMQNFARYVFDTEKYFDTYHFIPCNSPIRTETDTQIVGIAFVPDTQLDRIDTPHGEVIFLQMVGLTQDELDWLWQDPTRKRCEELINLMRKDNPLLITDLTRKKSYIPNENTKVDTIVETEQSLISKIKNFFK